MKKTTRIIGVVAIAMALTMVLSAGIAVASRPAIPTPETENIKTVTIITCIGAMTESEDLTWEISNTTINNTLDINEVHAKMTYRQNLKVTAGATEFSKNFKVDTGATPNLDVMKSIGFAQGGTIGTLSHQEKIGMELIANWTAMGNVMICPFAAARQARLPAACEYVTMESNMAVTEVLATTLGEITLTDSPIEVGYQITATGLAGAGTLAQGTAKVAMDVSVEDGSADNIPAFTLGSTVAYGEETVVIGLFELFKSMEYQSIIRP